MNHHWDTWLRNTLIWGIASFLIAAVALHYKWGLVLVIAAASSIIFVIRMIFKVAEGQRLNRKERRKRKASIHEYEQESPSLMYDQSLEGVHHSSHDAIDIDHDSDIDLDFDYD